MSNDTRTPSGLGRFMYLAQWVTPLVWTFALVFGPGLARGESLAMPDLATIPIIAWASLIVGWVGAGLSMTAPENRAARALHSSTATLNLLATVLYVFSVTFHDDGGERGPLSRGLFDMEPEVSNLVHIAVLTAATITLASYALSSRRPWHGEDVPVRR